MRAGAPLPKRWGVGGADMIESSEPVTR